MANVIISQRPANRIWVSRDWHLYTHKIYRNGVLVSADNIDWRRAREIILENPQGYTIGHEEVDFTGAMAQFTFEIPIEEAGSNDHH